MSGQSCDAVRVTDVLARTVALEYVLPLVVGVPVLLVIPEQVDDSLAVV